MTTGNIIALFFSMVVLAAIPGTSVIAVVSRSISSGFYHGFLTAAGIVSGDLIFLLIAILGLTFVAQAMGPWFYILKYCAGIYLIWFGVVLYKTRLDEQRLHFQQEEGVKEQRKLSTLSSFMCGLLITLGDAKAILFYIGFLPAYVDLENITLSATAIIMLVTVVAVGGVKLVYAYMADSAVSRFKNTLIRKVINIMAASLMILMGFSLLIGVDVFY